MATSDSEDFESADENIEANATGVKNKKVKSGNGVGPPVAEETKRKSKSAKDNDVAGGERRTDTSVKGMGGGRVNRLPGNRGEGSKEKSIDEGKVFDMFDDKTSDAEERRKASDKKRNDEKGGEEKKEREGERSVGVKRLGTRLGGSDKTGKTGGADAKPIAKKEEKETAHASAGRVSVEKEEAKAGTGKVEGRTDDGWDLEDGFEIPVADDGSKPKHEEFEKELFPVLDKLSSLSTSTKKETEEVGQKQPGGAAAGWGGWSGWGVGSFISNATESVSTLTSHVSAGINTVLETGLGAPDPQLLAEETLEKEKLEQEKGEGQLPKGGEEKPAEEGKADESDGKQATGLGGFGQLMSGVSQLGTKVLSGGLDTLETLGKKTMEVLQEGDPGLRKKRAMFFQDDDKPVLSQILREAKENAEHSNKLEEEKQAAKKVHLESLFDDYQGLVHLEALEMLSKQCQLKLQSILLALTGDALKDLQETLEQVKDLCELPDEEEDEDKDDDKDFAKKIAEAIATLAVDVQHTKILEASKSIEGWLDGEEAKACSPVQVHQKAVASMAEFTSAAMEMFHRAGELLLIKPHRSTADEAESLTQLTTILCSHVSRMATKFTMLLTENVEPNENNKMITTIFMESAECSSYIQDACRLLVPVLQLGAAS